MSLLLPTVDSLWSAKSQPLGRASPGPAAGFPWFSAYCELTAAFTLRQRKHCFLEQSARCRKESSFFKTCLLITVLGLVVRRLEETLILQEFSNSFCTNSLRYHLFWVKSHKLVSGNHKSYSQIWKLVLLNGNRLTIKYLFIWLMWLKWGLFKQHRMNIKRTGLVSGCPRFESLAQAVISMRN